MEIRNVCLLNSGQITNHFASYLKPATSAQESADLFLIANGFLLTAQETQDLHYKKHYYYVAELLFEYCGEREGFLRIRGHVVVADTISLELILDRLQALLYLHFEKKACHFFTKSQQKLSQIYNELIQHITEIKTLSPVRLTNVYAILQTVLKMAAEFRQTQESSTLAAQLDEFIDDFHDIYVGSSTDQSHIKSLADQ